MTDAPLPESPLTETALPEFTPDEVRAQLAELTFDSVGSFDQEAAYSLGTLAAEIVRERGFALAVQVVLGEHIVYKAALGGVSADTTSWLRRKANVALRDAQPSLLTRLQADPRAPRTRSTTSSPCRAGRSRSSSTDRSWVPSRRRASKT